MSEKIIRCTTIAFALVSLFLVSTFIPPAYAAPITFKCVTFLPVKDRHLDYFHKFLDRIKEQSKGELEIKIIGGPEAIPPFQQMEALRSGVVDMVATCGAYYVGDLPEGWTFQYGNLPPLEERKVGFYDFMDNLHQKKLNAKYLGRFSYPGRFYFFSNVPLRRIDDFKGKRIRVSPGYEAFVKVLGASMVTSTFSEVYTIMERGVVDAFAWPIPGPLEYGWLAVFKYVILPGFYEMNTVTHMNLNSFNRLPPHIQKIVMDNVIWMEKEIVPYYENLVEEQVRIMTKEKGKEAITVENPKKYLKMADDAAWEMIRSKIPETGPKIEKMIRRE